MPDEEKVEGSVEQGAGVDMDTPEDAMAEAGGFGGAATKKEEEAPAAEVKEEAKEKPKEEPEGKVELDPLDQPITDWSKVDLGLGEDVQASAEAIESFSKVAIEAGITPRQAQALARWQVEEIGRAREKMIEDGIKELKKEWGRDAGAKQAQVVSLIERIDHMAGNDSFSRAINESGASCHAGFVRGLLALAMLAAEDSIGSHAQAGAAPLKEDALAGLKAVFESARGK